MSHHDKTKAQKSSLPATTVTPVAAAIGVVLRGGQVLLVRRANQPDAGSGAFPVARSIRVNRSRLPRHGRWRKKLASSCARCTCLRRSTPSIETQVDSW
jgi:hypothetical protein